MRHVFGYLKKHYDSELVFDLSPPYIGMNAFERRDWTTSEFGCLLEVDSKPERQLNVPASRGIGFSVRSKADADHTANADTRRSKA